MAIPDCRLQRLINAKDPVEALEACSKHEYSEGWAIIDGALVIYDLDSLPLWLQPVIRAQDENGNTTDEVSIRESDEEGCPVVLEFGVGSAITGTVGA